MTRGEWLLLWLAAAVIALSAGCSSTPTIKVPERIYLDRPVPCLKAADVPQKPALRTQAELLALDTYRRTHALWPSYGLAMAYIGELEAAVRACSALPEPERPP